jgi:hypothetical protein
MSDDSKVQSENSFLKYIQIFIIKTPISGIKNYSHGVNRIFEELQKT